MIVYESNTNWSIGLLTVNPDYYEYRVDGIELDTPKIMQRTL